MQFNWTTKTTQRGLYQKSTSIAIGFIQLAYCTYCIFSRDYSFKNKLKTTHSFFFDKIFSTKQVHFYKLGANLDSITKVSITKFYGILISLALTVFDKANVIFSTKKTTENLWSSLSLVFSKYRRDSLGLFKFFWFFSIFSVFFIFLI